MVCSEDSRCRWYHAGATRHGHKKYCHSSVFSNLQHVWHLVEVPLLSGGVIYIPSWNEEKARSLGGCSLNEDYCFVRDAILPYASSRLSIPVAGASPQTATRDDSDLFAAQFESFGHDDAAAAAAGEEEDVMYWADTAAAVDLTADEEEEEGEEALIQSHQSEKEEQCEVAEERRIWCNQQTWHWQLLQ